MTTQQILAFTCLQTLVGAALHWVLALVLLEWRTFDWSDVAPHSISAVVYLALFGTIVGHTCYLQVLSKVAAHKVTTYALITPVIAVALGAAVLDEKIATATVVAAVLVLVGVALVLFKKGIGGGERTAKLA